MKISIVPISTKDLNQLKGIALKTFEQSYQHLNTKSNFDWYIQKAFTSQQLLSEIQNKKSFFYFIMNWNIIIGYLKLNIDDSQTEKYCKECLEIERIYLEANYKRKGIGRKILTFAAEKAKELTKNKVWLGVWDQNPDAILFYKKQGFVERGSHIFKFGDENQIDIIMEKSITD